MKNQAIKCLVLGLLVLVGCLIAANYVFAYKLDITLPGAPAEVNNPADYVNILFKVGFYLIGFLAVLMIAIGGIQYMAGGVSQTQISKAKTRIFGAVLGVVLLFCSYLVLKTIDPNIIQLEPGIKPVGKIDNTVQAPYVCTAACPVSATSQTFSNITFTRGGTTCVECKNAALAACKSDDNEERCDKSRCYFYKIAPLDQSCGNQGGVGRSF